MPPLPEPKRDDETPRNDEGNVGFVLVPRDNADGTPTEQTLETVRRQKAVLYHAKRLAEQHGLKLDDIIQADPFALADPQRGNEIKRPANPEMADVAAGVRMSRQTLKIRQPDGTEIQASKTDIELDAIMGLARTIKAIASVLTEPFKWSGRLSMRCGTWLKAHVAVSSGDEEKAE